MNEPTVNPTPPLAPTAPLTCLDADLVGRIDRALQRVGDFGQVHLIVVKGRLRFIEVLQSESVDSRTAISPRMARIDTKKKKANWCQFVEFVATIPSPMNTMPPSTLLTKIAHREAHVAIIGLGSVGLPLAIAFARAGVRVTGIDIDQRKVDAITRGHASIGDVPSAVLAHDTVTTAVHASAKSTNGAVNLQCPGADAGYLRPATLRPFADSGPQGSACQPFGLEPSRACPERSEGAKPATLFSPERIDPGRSDDTVANTPKKQFELISQGKGQGLEFCGILLTHVLAKRTWNGKMSDEHV